MTDHHSISLILPCHNEEHGLKEMLPSVPDGIDNVIVVDNHSTDQTAQVAREHGAQVIEESKKGYGAAIKRGFLASDCDIIITMDGDNTYPVGLSTEIVKYLLQNDLDFISCSRFPLQNSRAMPIVNKTGNYILTLVTGLLFKKKIRDSQSGMWVFRRSVLERITLESDGMSLSQEIKIKTILQGLAFHEYHIPYYERAGPSKLNRFWDGLGNLLHLFRLRLQYLRR